MSDERFHKFKIEYVKSIGQMSDDHEIWIFFSYTGNASYSNTTAAEKGK